MANPTQAQAIHEISQYLQADGNAREDFEDQAYIAAFRNWIMAYIGHWKINSSRTMTCIQLKEEWPLYNNLRVAMIKEVVGLGPQRYCIVVNQDPTFYSKLKLVMAYLPHSKMFLYPAGSRLEGPFLQEPWLSRGRTLSSRPSLTAEEFHASFDDQ